MEYKLSVQKCISIPFIQITAGNLALLFVCLAEVIVVSLNQSCLTYVNKPFSSTIAVPFPSS